MRITLDGSIRRRLTVLEWDQLRTTSDYAIGELSGRMRPVPEQQMRPLRTGPDLLPLEVQGRSLQLPEFSVEGEGDSPSARALVMSVVRLLRRRWRFVVGIWLLTLVPLAAYILMRVPEFTSEGAVQVSKGSPFGGASPLMEMAVGMGPKTETETEVEILRRRQFLVTTLTSLRLHVEDADGPGSFSPNLAITLGGESPVGPQLRSLRKAVDTLEVPRTHFESTRVVVTTKDDQNLELQVGPEDEEERYLLQVGELLDLPTIRVRFKRAPFPPGEAITVKVLPEGELLKEYRERIGIGSLGNARMPTNIVRIFAIHPDRDTARVIVQTMMEQYLQQTLEWQSESASKAASFIESQLEEVRRNLRVAEDKLLQFSRQERAVQLDTQARVEIEKAADLETQRVALELQEKTIGGVLARLSNGGSPKASLTANFFEDPVLAASISALTEAETKHEMLRASYEPGHPHFQELERAINLQRAEVARLMKSAQKNLSAQRKQIEDTLAVLNDAMSHYPDKQVELARLTRDMEVSQRLYTLLLEKLEEAEIIKASTTTDKRIVDNASTPHDKTSPQRAKVALLGVIGGLALGFAGAFMTHLLQQRLDTVDAIRDIATVPTYGTVPEASLKSERFAISDVWSSTQSNLGEAFRALGVSVSLTPGTPGQGRLLAVTSSQPGEGKSTVSANLAVALSRNDKRVLLVDLDLRRPTQHRMWGVPRQPGYSELIGRGADPNDLAEFGQQIEGVNATLLPAGTRLADPVAAVMNTTLPNLLSAWKRDFDFVLLDCPPVFVAETVALVQHADLVLLVARPGVLERGNLQHATEILSRVDVPKGLVLNGVSRKHADDTYGSGYYYYYGRAYGPNDDDPKASARS